MSLILDRADDIGAFFNNRTSATQSYHPSELWHVYVKLDFEKKYENAEHTEDAKSFLRSVTRASILTHQVAAIGEGKLIEIQGSLMHVVLPVSDAGPDAAFNFAGKLHIALGELFANRGERVQGWRMVADNGKTLLINGPSIHGDQSTVSLGNAANRPAKRLYQQLALSEDDRSLKRFHLEIRNKDGKWTSSKLKHMVIMGNFNIEGLDIDEIRGRDLSSSIKNVLHSQSLITASAQPIDNPTHDDPQISWGWVLRADIDGFTQRVSDCYDNDAKLEQLARNMLLVMRKAADFANAHNEMITQLPWAGDNFNAVANYPDKETYERAVVQNLIELSVDFEEDLNQEVVKAGCGGWSQCVAGSYPHGNCSGNVYVSLIPVDGRYFLVGVGRGIGKSLQAMSEISPDAQELVILNEDHEKIHEDYQQHFSPSSKNGSGVLSTLYKSADITALEDERDERETAAKPVAVTDSHYSSVNVSTRPYFHG